MKPTRMRLVPTLVSLLAAATLAAEDGSSASTSAISTGDVPTLVVSTTRLETPADSQPVATNIIDEELLQERQPRTTAEALRYQPGIWVQQTGHYGGAPIIRGAIGNRVLYLFNGIRRNTGSLFPGPNAYLNDIDPMSIQRIEVIRGPASVLYGSDAIGGVVNVISARMPTWGATTSLSGEVIGRYGSNDEEESGRLSLHGGSGDLFGAAGCSRTMVDAPESGDRQMMTPGGYDQHQLDGQADWRINAHVKLEFFGQKWQDKDATRYDRPYWLQHSGRQQYAARLQTNDTGMVRSTTSTLYVQDQTSYIDERWWDSDSADRTLGFDSQATLAFAADWTVTAGVHAHRDRSTSEDSQNQTKAPDTTWDNPAIFGLLEWQATGQLTISAGARADQYRLKSKAPAFSDLAAPVQQAITNGSFALSDLELNDRTNALTGSLGAVYQMTDAWHVFASVGNAFRAPNSSDLLSYGQFTQGFGVPSANVKPETSLTYELGSKWDAPAVSGSITGYLTRLRNAVVQVPGTFNGSPYVDVNGNSTQDAGEQVMVKTNSSDTITGYGIEFENDIWIPKAVTRRWVPGDIAIVLNGTWNLVSGRDDNQLSQSSLLPVPNNGLVGLRWENVRGAQYDHVWLECDLQGVDGFHGGTSADIAQDPAFWKDPQMAASGRLRADGSIPGYGIVNVRTGVDTRHGSLVLAVENLTDRAYRQAWTRMDAMGTNVTLTGTMRF